MLTSLLELWNLMPFLDADKGGGGGGGADDDDADRDDQDADDDITDEDDDIEDDDEDREDSDDDDDDDEPLGKAGTKALRKERRLRRDAEAKLRKLQRQDDDEDDESDDDADLEARLARTQRQLHEARAETALTKAATKAGAVSVRAVVALAREELKFDKGGKPRNLRSVIRALKEDDPELFRAADGSADGGEGGSGTAVRDLNASLRRQIRKARRGG